MKPSERLRGRAKAFELDRQHVSKRLDAWSDDATNDYRQMKDRLAAYGVICDELHILADELEREGI